MLKKDFNFQFPTGKDDRTQEWIMTGGGSQKFSGMQYQNWSTVYNRFGDLDKNGEDQNVGGSGNQSVSSKLDPNSKPFAPRQPPLPSSKTASPAKPNLDENENKVDGGVKPRDELRGKPHDELRGAIIRQIWGEKPASSPKKIQPLATSKNENIMQKVISDSALVPKSINSTAVKCTSPDPAKDDFGLRSLLRNITVSVSSLKSETSSVLSNDDLGMSGRHRAFFKDRKGLAYPYMESPLNNNVINPMSDFATAVPNEYMHGLGDAGSLPKLELNKLATDLLFYLFYVAVGDSLQLEAATELFQRGWRFNTSQQLWVARLPSVNPDIRHKTYEKGLYQYFNPSTWRRETKTMALYYAELASGNKH